MMYKSLVKGLSSPDLLTKVETEAITGELEYQVKTEAEFIKYIQDRLNQSINETVKFIPQTILKEEIYHQQLLYSIRELVIKKHKMLDTVLWEMIWKELMKH